MPGNDWGLEKATEQATQRREETSRSGTQAASDERPRGQAAGFCPWEGHFHRSPGAGNRTDPAPGGPPAQAQKDNSNGGGGREAAAPFFKHEGRGRRREKGCTAHHCHLAARETERYKLRKKIIFSTTPLRGDLQIVAVGAT